MSSLESVVEWTRVEISPKTRNDLEIVYIIRELDPVFEMSENNTKKHKYKVF